MRLKNKLSFILAFYNDIGWVEYNTNFGSQYILTEYTSDRCYCDHQCFRLT